METSCDQTEKRTHEKMKLNQKNVLKYYTEGETQNFEHIIEINRICTIASRRKTVMLL
jgi:hypothetical protein